jgi:hypothetical protein
VESGEALATFKGHSKGIPALSWSPDGKRLASGADDKTLVIWNTESGIAEAVIFDHRGDVDCVAWHPDGEMLATSSEDGVVRVYRWLDDRPDLFTYLREGMCEFNADSDLLEWRAPRPNLYDSRSFPFRNVPYGSMLDVLQRCDATTSAGVAQRDWLLYLQFLTADNWASVRLLYERLAVEERKRPHTSVIAACRRLASLVAGQLKSGDEQGALKRLDLALLLSRDLAIRGKEAFYLALGRRFAAERLGEGDVQVVFDRLPDDEARELVKRGFK